MTDHPLKNGLIYVHISRMKQVGPRAIFWSKEMWELDCTEAIFHPYRWKVWFQSRRYNLFYVLPLRYCKQTFSFNCHIWYNLAISSINLSSTMPNQYWPRHSMGKIPKAEIQFCIHYLHPPESSCTWGSGRSVRGSPQSRVVYIHPFSFFFFLVNIYFW